MGAKNILEFGVETFRRATGMRAWEKGVIQEPTQPARRILSASAELLFPTTTAYARESERVHIGREYGEGDGKSALDGIAMSALMDFGSLLGASVLLAVGAPQLAIGGKLLSNSLLTHWPKCLNTIDEVLRK